MDLGEFDGISCHRKDMRQAAGLKVGAEPAVEVEPVEAFSGRVALNLLRDLGER